MPFSGKIAGLELKKVLDNLPVGIVIIEAPDGKVVYTNQRANELYGVDPKGLQIPEHSNKAMRLLTMDGATFPPEQLPASIALQKGEKVFNVDLIIEQPTSKRYNRDLLGYSNKGC
jgi:PAS domain-containing protein